jgi:hypothetical protein
VLLRPAGGVQKHTITGWPAHASLAAVADGAAGAFEAAARASRRRAKGFLTVTAAAIADLVTQVPEVTTVT